MIWIQLLLCAIAAILAAAAFRRSGGAAASDVRESAREAALRQDFAQLRASLDALPGRISDELAGSPLREAVEAARGDVARLGEELGAHGERMRQSQEALLRSSSDSLRELLAAIPEVLAPLARGVEAVKEELGAARREAQAASRANHEDLLRVAEAAGKVEGAVRTASDRAVAETLGLVSGVESIQAVLSTRETDEGVREEVRNVAAALAALPARIAEEIAARPSPAPELEELAVAVRESGHLRGDVARQVAEAVSRVGQELSDAGRSAVAERETVAASLEDASRALASAIEAVREAVAPLQGALAAHGEALAPLSASLEAARDRLEDASGTQRANQVEFAASVEVFGRAAQDLAGGLSSFAREGELGVAEDPRAAQKALLESLDRVLSGFAESLKALLAESDVRTREALVEIAARMPVGGKDA